MVSISALILCVCLLPFLEAASNNMPLLNEEIQTVSNNINQKQLLPELDKWMTNRGETLIHMLVDLLLGDIRLLELVEPTLPPQCLNAYQDSMNVSIKHDLNKVSDNLIAQTSCIKEDIHQMSPGNSDKTLKELLAEIDSTKCVGVHVSQRCFLTMLYEQVKKWHQEKRDEGMNREIATPTPEVAAPVTTEESPVTTIVQSIAPNICSVQDQVGFANELLAVLKKAYDDGATSVKDSVRFGVYLTVETLKTMTEWTENIHNQQITTE